MISKAFSRAAAKPEGTNSIDFVEAILQERPDLKGQMAYSPEYGNSGHTLFIGDEVFKGPKEEKQIADITRECQVLQRLGDKGLAVPKVTHVGQDAIFFGMTKLKGVCLTKDIIVGMTAEEQERAARDIAKFIAGLAQAFSDEEAMKIGDKQFGRTPDPEKIAQALNNPDVQKVLGPQLPFCREMMQEYFDILSSKKLAVTHIDFHSKNIMVDPDAKKLSGVIDFGAIANTLPEAGLISLQQNYPRSFIKEICRKYSQLQSQELDYRDILLCKLSFDIMQISHRLKRDKQANLDDVIGNIQEGRQALNGGLVSGSQAPQSSPKNRGLG